MKTIILTISLIFCSANIKGEKSNDIYSDIYDCISSKSCFCKKFEISGFNYIDSLVYGKDCDTVYVYVVDNYLIAWNNDDTLTFVSDDIIEYKQSIFNKLMLDIVSEWKVSKMNDYIDFVYPTDRFFAMLKIVFLDGVYDIYCNNFVRNIAAEPCVQVITTSIDESLFENVEYDEFGNGMISSLLVNYEDIVLVAFENDSSHPHVAMKFHYNNKIYYLPIKKNFFQEYSGIRGHSAIIDIKIETIQKDNCNKISNAYIDDIEFIDDGQLEYREFPRVEFSIYNAETKCQFKLIYLIDGLIIKIEHEKKYLYYSNEDSVPNSILDLINKIKFSKYNSGSGVCNYGQYGRRFTFNTAQNNKYEVEIKINDTIKYFDIIESIEEMPKDMVDLFLEFKNIANGIILPISSTKNTCN